MATTTIHIPDDLLARIDVVARKNGISRNRFLIQASRDALARQSGEWPAGFFDQHLSDGDQRELEAATQALERTVLTSRHNRGAAAL